MAESTRFAKSASAPARNRCKKAQRTNSIHVIKTKGDIIRLGELIRKQYPNIERITIQDLEDFRTSHKDSLASIFKHLCKIRYKASKNMIVTYRIKRFESIINKLRRLPNQKFDRMWDIGGCRCIVNSDEEVYKLRDEIAKYLIIKKVNDYLKNPQEDGYKSLHLYVHLPGDDKTVEIQIRNQVDHNWATLVEISDLLFDSGLKEYGKNKELQHFHRLLSQKSNLKIDQKREIAEIIKKYNYTESISKVFTRNHINVREQWIKIQSNAKLTYFLIETSKSEIPKITAYDNFNDAENDYFSSFKNNQKANIVLTHLPKPSYNQISIAYSNYILTMHSFEDESAVIFEELIIEALKEGNFYRFFIYFDYYQNIIINRAVNSVKELVHSKSVVQRQSLALKKILTKKEKEWQSDIRNEFKNSNLKIKKFVPIFQSNLPRRGMKRFVVKKLMRFIFWKYQSRLKKLENTSIT